MPGSKHACPKRAACWSPAMPLTGTARPAAACSGAVTPKRPLLGRTSGRHEAGTPSSSQRSSDQQRLRMSKRSVRLAFDGSVACTPPVRTAGEVPEDPRVDGPEGEVRPRLDAALGEQPLQLRPGEVWIEDQAGGGADERDVPGVAQLVAARGRAAVLPHDRPVHGPTPVVRSQTTTVSRWLVMPIAATVSPSSAMRGRDLAERLEGGRPDVVGVVLDPARSWEVLRELPVGPAANGRPARRPRAPGPRWCPRRSRRRPPSARPPQTGRRRGASLGPVGAAKRPRSATARPRSPRPSSTRSGGARAATRCGGSDRTDSRAAHGELVESVRRGPRRRGGRAEEPGRHEEQATVGEHCEVAVPSSEQEVHGAGRGTTQARTRPTAPRAGSRAAAGVLPQAPLDPLGTHRPTCLRASALCGEHLPGPVLPSVVTADAATGEDRARQPRLRFLPMASEVVDADRHADRGRRLPRAERGDPCGGAQGRRQLRPQHRRVPARLAGADRG